MLFDRSPLRQDLSLSLEVGSPERLVGLGLHAVCIAIPSFLVWVPGI